MAVIWTRVANVDDFVDSRNARPQQGATDFNKGTGSS